jgi:hypothetical protein
MHRESGLLALARSDTAAPMPAASDPQVRTMVRTPRSELPIGSDRNRSDRSRVLHRRPAGRKRDLALARSDIAAPMMLHRPAKDVFHPDRRSDALAAEAMNGNGTRTVPCYGSTPSLQKFRRDAIRISGRSARSHCLWTGPPTMIGGSMDGLGSSVSIRIGTWKNNERPDTVIGNVSLACTGNVSHSFGNGLKEEQPYMNTIARQRSIE